MKKQELLRLLTYPISEVLPFRKEQTGQEEREYSGHKVKMSSMRYRIFSKDNWICQVCGLQGSFFALEKHPKSKYDKYHFNLYGLSDEEDILFTKDHIIPSSCGGSDHINNMTTMCSPCNNEKDVEFSRETAKQIAVIIGIPIEKWKEDPNALHLALVEHKLVSGNPVFMFGLVGNNRKDEEVFYDFTSWDEKQGPSIKVWKRMK